ncbi:class I SAM-dependent methyltransferase [Chthonobacter rhizosphaerae]|uniref:class I SAM-dependent methyltransferase n=1 Tax=Chthonobacter rhizosphaerae TaxID=2735553 RepID=UPI0015EF6454|nr:class I SAM-dependent methyltransferase [Chthonobacter rhizosphaerae]
MTDPDPTAPDLETRAAAVVDACRAGSLAGPMALTRLLMLADAEEDARGLLSRLAADEPDTPCWRDLLALLAARPTAFATVKGLLSAVVHGAPRAGGPDAAIAATAAMFDRAVALSPEGGVALYSLGDPTLLAAATDELVRFMEAQGLLRQDYDVLEIGCGIGRIMAALAGRVRSVHGLDISPAMVAEAKARCAGLPNATVALTDGRDLSTLDEETFDLVLAIDAFPYLVDAGGDVVARHVAEAARVLRPGGRLLVVNYSYRDDPAADRADFEALGRAAGLQPLAADDTPFRLWDGRVYLARRP